MSSNNFYPLTAETLEKLYKANLTAAEWRLWTYLVTLDPWGDKYKDLPNTLAVMEKVEIKKSTFYAAIAKFQKFDLFDFQDKGFQFRNLRGIPKIQKSFQETGSDSEISENAPNFRKTLQENGEVSKKPENQRSKRSPGKRSKSSHTYKTYKTYTNSLSDEQRESFLEFGKKKASELPNPPTLTSKWVETHWEELRSQWEKSQGKVSAALSCKWENHPQREEWLEKIRQLGPAGFQAEDMDNQKLRRDFYVWADANNLIWGDER
ncbi:hypothetical protein VB713_20410 [Anabaena cylindrica UHCC 0172]|uniref:hypothetical protein n=1 Tax=Anabaena cylindrica TaxID=1165 RepID=UPI002B213B26|nr:hypothetical protein [Anabaena cylindrica]MEA5553305.1 hypothetical protein [Anabaena cylindrica UHCC 0172]